MEWEALSGEPAHTASDVLASAGLLTSVSRRADTLVLVRATEWADLHPPVPGEGAAWEDPTGQLPEMAWDAPAEFAAAIGLKEEAGRRLIHEALELRHRLPEVWRRMLAGDLPAWKARRIADATIGTPADVAASMNATLGPIAHKVGPITLDRLVNEAMMRLHPVEFDRREWDALDSRSVKLYDDISHGGIATIQIRADLKDASDFDEAVGLVAAALADQGCTETLDVRRSMAVGVLADPQGALDLLSVDSQEPGDQQPRRPRKRIQLYLHLSEQAVQGHGGLGRVEGGTRPLIEGQIRDWCGRTDTYLTVTPVLDLADHHPVEAYEIPHRLDEQAALVHDTCAYPYCTRPAHRCDTDHRVPHAAGGLTCPCNLTPLCRHHHRLKTLKGWRYFRIAIATYLWRSPHGLLFITDPTGTQSLDLHAWQDHHPPPADAA